MYESCTLEKVAEAFSQLHHYAVKTAERESIAVGFLKNTTGKAAITLLASLRNLYGIESLYWEPETLWLTLNRDGIDLDVIARDKVQAAISLVINPSFFWDSLVFQRTVQSLNDVLYDPETLQECSPAHMAWSMYEAQLIRSIHGHVSVIELDEDVQQYAAVCCCRDGLIFPPQELLQIADNIRKMLPDKTSALITTVKNSWEHIPKTSLDQRVFEENPVGIQTAKLASIYIYIKDQLRVLIGDLLSLEHAKVPPLSVP